MATRLGTTLQWRENNPIPANGDLCICTDTSKTKTGDGSSTWRELDFDVAGGGGGVTNGDKGDITVVGNSWTVDALAITDSKVNDIAAIKVTQGANNRFTTDAEKATWNAKQDALVSGTSLKTINSTSLLGAGDIAITGTIADGDKGDITVSGTGTVFSIDPGVVTLAKMANMATGSVIYRKTAATGVPEVQTLAVLAADLPALNQNTTGSAATLTTPRNINGVAFNGSANITVPAAGSTLTDTVPVAKGGTGLVAVGTANQILRTNAGATGLEWATPSAGGGSVATDVIWDAAGDLAVGSGADTAVRLAKGTSLQVLRVNSGATALEWASPAGGGDALTANTLAQFAPTTSAQLATLLTDETGTGSAVFANTPTLVSPILGTPTSGVLTNCTGTAAGLTAGTATVATGLTASTVSSIGVGTVELGHATDTTISRVSAGVIAVEGATVPTLTSVSTFITGLKTFAAGMFALRNVAGTFNALFTNTNTADRTYTLPDVTGTIALTSNITDAGLTTTDVTTNNFTTAKHGFVPKGTNVGNFLKDDGTWAAGGGTIADGSVTLAKLANVATGTVFYRKTAAAGVPEVQTLATLKTDLGIEVSMTSAVYGVDGITSWSENGVAFTATYSGGKIATITGGGRTKTFTWSGNNLVSAVWA